jgi:myo-inositol catabolism protein IolS
MKYRLMAGVGSNVSVVGIGTWQFSGEWSHTFTQCEVDAILAAARETGINLIDTAECYGDHFAEELIGRAIQRDRNQWVIATKFGHRFLRPFERQRAYAPEAVRRQLEASLRALNTDYIDIYQFHSAENVVFDSPALWEMLSRQVEAGKVLALGVSIRDPSDAFQVEKAADFGIRVVQLAYNRLDQTAASGVLETCSRRGLGVLVRQPLASGFLTGKYEPGATFPENDVRERWYSGSRRADLIRAAQIREAEVPPGLPMPVWAIGWCLRNPAVTCVVPGCKSPDQVRMNSLAADAC